MTDNEMLLALSELLDKKLDSRLKPMEERLKPIEERLKRIEVDLLENNVIPRLNTIESCYTSTYNRYKEGVAQIESLQTDMDMIKQIVREHSEKLSKIS